MHGNQSEKNDLCEPKKSKICFWHLIIKCQVLYKN